MSSGSSQPPWCALMAAMLLGKIPEARCRESPTAGAKTPTGSGDSAARHSKADKDAELVERAVCFISKAGNLCGGWVGEGRLLSKGQLPPDTITGQEPF